MSQDKWDKNRRLIEELEVIEREGRYGMPRARMESIRRFFGICIQDISSSSGLASVTL